MSRLSSVDVTLDDLPPAVVRQAVASTAYGPEPAPESGAVRVLTPTYCVFVTPMPTVTFVEALDVAPASVADVVAEVRELLRARGRAQAAWTVPVADETLHDALRDEGMTPYDEPPLERMTTCMALVDAPSGQPAPGVDVRRAAELDDYLVASRIAGDVFGFSGPDRDAHREAMRRRFELDRQGRSTMLTYLATVDGVLVGEAQATVMDAGLNLSGGSVREHARGRGVYRALVAARWTDAVARGTAALTVQAGVMSRPALERLGFRTVQVQHVLRDRFG